MADPMSYMGSQSGERPLCRSEAYAGDLLSKLLQIEFDLSDSLFQGFVFVWHMFWIGLLELPAASERFPPHPTLYF
jgi:hypothetical protein